MIKEKYFFAGGSVDLKNSQGRAALILISPNRLCTASKLTS